MNPYTCDECARPATHFVRDAIETTGPGETEETFKVGDLRKGCADHRPTRYVRYRDGRTETVAPR